jgi:hypothetical protein
MGPAQVPKPIQAIGHPALTTRRLIVLIVCGLLLGFLFIAFPAPAERMLNIQNYLITVGGIISAFVISYLSAKIFSLRTEREQRQLKIEDFSEKLTDFRRLLYYIMTSREFWVRYDDIKKFRNKYPQIRYEDLHASSLSATAMKVYEDEDFSYNTVDLYCAMMAIYGDPELSTGSAWALDKAAHFNYTPDNLIKYRDPCNQIWYYLEGRFAKHGQGRFADKGINPLWRGYVNDLLPKINIKYKGAAFH